jgi:hypothetical protein
MAYGLLGAVENVVMRAAWDDRYSRRDVLWTTLCMFLAVQALYSGRLDLGVDIARYADTVERLVETPPPVPPAVLA